MSTANQFRIQADFSIQAAAEGDAPTQPTFEIEAYSGGAIRQWWSRNPMVVDLAGMVTQTPMPLLYGHSGDGGFTGQPLDGVLGQIVRAEATQRLRVAGDMLGEGQTYDRVISLAKKGMKFQASIGADVGRTELVEAGQAVTVNGRQFTGPISVVRASTLREVSIVLMGADPNTSAAIAAQASNGGDPMAHDATNTPAEPITASTDGTASVAVGQGTAAPAGQVSAGSESTTTQTPSVAEITATVTAAVLEQLRAANLEGIRASRPHVAAVHVVQRPEETTTAIVAGLCMAGGLRDIEKRLNEQTLEAAYQRRSVGFQEVLLRAAKANGYDRDVYKVTDSNLRDVLRAAFSTHSIANVTSATYGKFLLDGFTAVEATWDAIASVRPVNDYKLVTGVRVNGGFEFEEVGNGGELKSADASDETRTIGAKLFGRLSLITMQDIVNDDLGALTVVPQRLGRGAATRLNKSFWSEFEASNSTYYAKETAGGGNALAIGSLKTAASSYRKLKDPDGNPLGVSPSVLLVSPENEIPAAELMSGSLLITGENATRTNVNVLAGRYRVVSSSYLTSATTWWLCANPGELPAMEVAFLNGQRQPTVEQAEADFHTLGIAVRGHYSFGVAKAEKNGAYRMATA